VSEARELKKKEKWYAYVALENPILLPQKRVRERNRIWVLGNVTMRKCQLSVRFGQEQALCQR